MKSSKLFLTSLLAAAAMGLSVPAWAEESTIAVTKPANSNRVQVSTGSTLGTYTISGTSYTQTEEQTYVVNVAGNTQFFLDAWNQSNKIFNFDFVLNGAGGDDGKQANLRIHEGATISGNISLAADSTIWSSGSSNSITGKISSADGTTSSLTISDGNSYVKAPVTLTLSGGMELSGALTIVGGSYAGKLQLSDGTKTYSAASLAGAGTLTINSGVTFTLNNSATTAGTNQTFSGTLAGSGELKLTGGVQKLSGVTAANAINVAGGNLVLAGTNTLNGAVTVSGGTLDVSSGTHTFGNAFALNGGNVVLGDVSRLGDTALLSASTITATSGAVELSGVIKNGTYTIFTGTGSASLVESGISLTGTLNSGYTQAWAKDGNNIKVTISGAACDLIWSGATNTTWDTASANWKTSAEATESTRFNTYDYVTFNGDATVTVASGGVTAGPVTVSSGTLVLLGGTVTANMLVGSGTIQLGSLTGLSVGTANDANRFAAWTGTVAFKNISGVSGVGLDLRNYGNENSKIVFDGVVGTETNQPAQGLWLNGGDVAANIEIASGGLKVTNGTSNLVTNFTGALTGTGTFEYTRAINQTFKFSGDVSGFTGTLKSTSATFEFAPSTGTQTFNGKIVGDDRTRAKVTKSGAGELTFSASSSLAVATLTQSAGTLNISGAATIGTLNVTGGTGMTLSGTSVSIGTLENKSTGTINIGTGRGDTKVVAVNRFDIGDVNNSTKNSLNIKSDAVLKITGSTDGTNYDTVSLLLGEWGSQTLTTIEGKLLAQKASALAGNTGYEMTVADGGVLAVKGLGQAKNAASNVKLTLSDGGTAIFGSEGISLQNATNWSGLLGAGTIGTSSSTGTTIETTLTLTSATGTTFDTQLWNFASDGNDIARSADAASAITVNGMISGDGALKKAGAGTLTLNGNNTFTGGVTIEQGVLVAGHANALGTIAGTTTVNSDGVLKVAVDGGVTAGTVTLNEGALLAIDLTEYSNVVEGRALTIIASSAISFNSQEFSSDLMENTFFDLANSNLGSWSSYLREWSYDTTNGLQLTLTIPEPSVFGLLAGLGALALAGTRRRRKKA